MVPSDTQKSDAVPEITHEPLPYATGETPMLREPFPPPMLTAWVMLTMTMLCVIGGSAGMIWLIRVIIDSDQPLGAFACVPVPILLLFGTMIGLIRETINAFRRAWKR